MTRFPRLLWCLTAACVAVPLNALPQSYPSKPIRMIVPYPPGGIDASARIMTTKMSELLGQPIIIDNRGGANGIIGAEAAARSAPDGHTVLFVVASTLVGGILLMKNPPFDPVKDLTPISQLFESLRTITVIPSVPVYSIKDLIDYAKRNPGKLSYSSSGIGSVFHLDGELLKQAAGVDIVHIPHKGTALMTTEHLAGRVEVGIAGLINVRPYIASGKLRLLAIMEKKRHPSMPNVPTVAETLPGVYKTPGWIGLLAPAGVPQLVVRRLHSAAAAALNEPEVRKYHEENGNVIVSSTPEEFAATLRSDLESTARLLKSIGLQPE